MKGDGAISGARVKTRPSLSNLSFKKRTKSVENISKNDIYVVKNEPSVTHIENKAKLLLTGDETLAIMRHILAVSSNGGFQI